MLQTSARRRWPNDPEHASAAVSRFQTHVCLTRSTRTAGCGVSLSGKGAVLPDATEFWHHRSCPAAPAHASQFYGRLLRFIVQYHQHVLPARAGIPRREKNVPISRVGVSPDQLMPAIFRRIKTVCCKSAVTDGNSLFLRQSPAAIQLLRGATSNYQQSNERIKASHDMLLQHEGIEFAHACKHKKDGDVNRSSSATSFHERCVQAGAAEARRCMQIRSPVLPAQVSSLSQRCRANEAAWARISGMAIVSHKSPIRSGPTAKTDAFRPPSWPISSPKGPVAIPKPSGPGVARPRWNRTSQKGCPASFHTNRGPVQLMTVSTSSDFFLPPGSSSSASTLSRHGFIPRKRAATSWHLPFAIQFLRSARSSGGQRCRRLFQNGRTCRIKRAFSSRLRRCQTPGTSGRNACTESWASVPAETASRNCRVSARTEAKLEMVCARGGISSLYM